MKKYNCIDCGKEKSRNGKRCLFCRSISYWQQHLERRYKKHYCKCGKEICYDSIRCDNCNNIFQTDINSSNFKGGKPKCIDCGKKLSQRKVKNYEPKRCIKCSNKYRKGNLSGTWKGGISKLPYPFEFSIELKESIRNRDNYECQNCSMTEEEHLIVVGKVLPIHHIDYNKQNCNENNLITTCFGCNIRANFNRNYWTGYYTNKIVQLQKEI